MKKRNGFVLSLLITLQSSTSLAAAQQAESLLIGPGDMLHVQVFDTPELEEHARVTDGGELPLILGENVKIAGMPPCEAAHTIEIALSKEHYLIKPKVLVTVEEYATQRVSVLGEVKTPGAFVVNTPRSVADVLALAGGLTEVADRMVLIERNRTGQNIPYYVSNKGTSALETAVRVNPGDTLVVPKAGIVYVLGDVRTPGGYTMTNNESELTVLELVARAGGTNNSAVPSHTRLVRRTDNGYVETPIPLSEMQKGKRSDVSLQPNDILYVPFSYTRNFVLQGAGLVASAASAAVYRF